MSKNKKDKIENAENNIEEVVKEVEEVVDETSTKLQKAEADAKEYLDRLQRCMAEFDNFRKRTITEKAGIYDNGVKDTVEKLLPVIDNFERAIGSVLDEYKESAVFKGVEMISKQLIEILENMGVKEIPAQGETFDPNIHNAVMHIEDESFEENTIAEVLQKGYIYKEKVIRPSMVKVAN